MRGLGKFGPLNVVHFDAHMDYSHETQGVLYTHGTPIRRCRELDFVDHITSVGIRSARRKPYEESQRDGSLIITTRRFKELGPQGVVDLIPSGENLYVTFDIDVIDPSQAPGTGTPEVGGLFYEEARDCLEALVKRDNLVALDLGRGRAALRFLRNHQPTRRAPHHRRAGGQVPVQARAQSPGQPAGDASPMRTLFTNATLLDATGEPPRPGMAALVNQDRIAWIGPASEAQPPEGARVIDLAGKTLMPGLIDVHMHITQGATPDPTAEFTETIPFLALRGAANAATMLDSGYTTIRNLGAFGYSDVAIRQAIEQGHARGRAHDSVRRDGNHRRLRRARLPASGSPHTRIGNVRRRRGRAPRRPPPGL